MHAAAVMLSTLLSLPTILLLLLLLRPLHSAGGLGTLTHANSASLLWRPGVTSAVLCDRSPATTVSTASLNGTAAVSSSEEPAVDDISMEVEVLLNSLQDESLLDPELPEQQS